MHPNSLANLNKWTKGTSGNPAGRKLGSKNIATIVKELLEQDIDTRFPLNERLKQLITDNGTTYAKAIVYAMLLKAIDGDVRAATYLTELQLTGEANDGETGLFNTNKLQIEIVKPKHSTQN
jgi:heat shock protein HspQ